MTSQQFEAFYDAHAAAAYTMALSILGSVCEAEEVVREAFLDAWTDGEYCRPGDLLRTVRERSCGRLAPEVAAVPDPAVPNALGRLPTDVRAIIELSRLGGLTVPEVATAMCMPQAEVRGKMLVGLRSLARSL